MPWRQTLAIAVIGVASTDWRRRTLTISAAAVSEPWKLRRVPNLDGSAQIISYLAGQRAAYIEKQLRDFRGAGQRSRPDGGCLRAGAANGGGRRSFAACTTPRASELIRRAPGEPRRWWRGRPAAKVPACNSCHGVSTRRDFIAPRLEAQQAAYLAKELADFRAGRRTNDRKHVMQLVASRLSEADIELVAAYLATRPRDAPARLAGRR